MKALFSIALLCALLSPAILKAEAAEAPRRQASDANITGHTENARTKEHLPYVTISIKGTTIGVTTDATGHYFLKNLPVGEYTIEASCVGYKTDRQTIRTVAGKTTEVNFLLEEQAISMDEVVVSATRNETSKKEAGIIVNVASGKLFASTASNNLADGMSFQPGVRGVHRESQDQIDGLARRRIRIVWGVESRVPNATATIATIRLLSTPRNARGAAITIARASVCIPATTAAVTVAGAGARSTNARIAGTRIATEIAILPAIIANIHTAVENVKMHRSRNRNRNPLPRWPRRSFATSI
ncbi:MAG: carboxypeptidase-like regulatory domain-containing protein [Rikenellaceae bacterium]|jgi:hypothetical protein|nr:carboxypeptidase-like regulatory domain-containing protein [Rikenellaceae bacterium]